LHWITFLRSDEAVVKDAEEHRRLPCKNGSYDFRRFCSFTDLKSAYRARCFTRTDGTLIESVSELLVLRVQELRARVTRSLVPEFTLPSNLSDGGDRKIKWALEGLVQKGGFTLTNGIPGVGKTADVMRTLFLCADSTLVVFIAFEDTASLEARTGALEDAFGKRELFFSLSGGCWDLCSEEDWKEIRHSVDAIRSVHDPEDSRDVIVCMDNLNAGIRSEDRVMTGPDTVSRHIGTFRSETGFAVWLIAHENSRGEIFGANFLLQDLDVQTRITKPSRKGEALLHRRLKGRNCESNVDLHQFTLVPVSGTIRSSVEGETTVDAVKAEADVLQFGEAEQFITEAMPLVDSGGTIEAKQLRQILDKMLRIAPGETGDNIRKNRSRLKMKLMADGVLHEDGKRFAVGV
jgi:hypothetical protein